MLFQTHFHSEELTYFGPELCPHFILSRFRVEGSCLAAFIGPCQVKTEHLVDWEDRLQNDHIQAKKMIHFLGEFFGITLKEGVWIQRLIVSHIHAQLLSRGLAVSRSGDDLFVGSGGPSALKKLSVSIVTASPVSVLLHLGINVDSEGAPVVAIGLKDLNIEPREFAENLLRWFKGEFESVERACVKVRPVI